MRNKTLLFLYFSLAFVAANAQAKNIPNDYRYQDLKEKFPKASFIRLKMHTQDLFDIEKGELKIESNTEQELICLNENAVNLKKRSIGYDGFFPIVELDAALHYPNKGKYKVEKVKEFSDQAVITNGVSFYDDIKERTYEFEHIKEGAVLQYDLKRAVTDKYLTPSRRFDHSLITLSDRHEVKSHKDVELGFFTMNMDNSTIKYSEKTEGDYRYYVWEQLEEKQNHFNGQSKYNEHFWPLIIPYVKSYTINEEEQGVLNDINALHHWYSSLVGQVKASESEELKNLALEITKDKETELEKVKAVYQWVQSNIKYIAFSDGYGGFVPRNPDEIYEKRFGDCKDMSCLIINTLKELEIPAYFTWIGTRKIPYNYSDLPSPQVDNHMIATYYDEEGKPYFLDATNPNLRFGVAAYGVQNKEALVAFSPDSFTIEKVPLSTPMSNYSFERIEMKLDETTLVGKGEYLAIGYQSEDIHAYYENKTNDTERKDLLEFVLEKGSNKFNLTNYEYHWDDELKDSLRINYEFNLQSYSNKVNQDLYLNLNLYKGLKKFRIPESRSVATYFEYPYKERKEFILQLPEAATLKFIPEGSNYEDDFMAYRISYEQEKNQLKYVVEFEQKIIELSADDKEAWNKQIAKLSELLDQSTIITLNE